MVMKRARRKDTSGIGIVDRAMAKAASIGGPAAQQGFRTAMKSHPAYHAPKRPKPRARAQARGPDRTSQRLTEARQLSCMCREYTPEHR